MKNTYSHVWLATTASGLILIFAAIWYLDTHRPELFTLGTVLGILLAIGPIIFDYLKELIRLGTPYLGDLIGIVDKFPRLVICVSLFAILASGYGISVMLNGIVDRYRYVGAIRSMVRAHISETVQLPDPAVLAQAFVKFPSRREVPLLLVRTSRIFSHGDNWSQFIKYQGEFVSNLGAYLDGSEICNAGDGSFDPVIFAAVVNLESGASADHGTDGAKEKIAKAAKKSLELLDRCHKSTERNIVSLLIKDTVNDLTNSDRYPVAELEKALTTEIEGLAANQAASLMRTHTYQQFLDFLCYRDIKHIVEDQRGNNHIKNKEKEVKINTIVRRYRAILSLRAVTGADGDVLWYTTPGKLNLYRAFMSEGGFYNTVNTEYVLMIRELDNLNKEMKALMAAPAFKRFLMPAAWFRATPLDLSLEGAQLKTLTDGWLKKGW